MTNLITAAAALAKAFEEDEKRERGGTRYEALLALDVCPRCRGDLQPVAYAVNTWGCTACRETWFRPEEQTR